MVAALRRGFPEVAAGDRQKFPTLTSLRFFAAVHVLMFHFLPPVGESWAALRRFAGHGYTGVTFFYVLSGFVLAHAYRHRGLQAANERRAFWWRRFARIYPLYLVALVAYAPFVIRHRFATDAAPAAALKTAIAAATNLLAVQAWLPPLASAWNPPSWSVSVEVLFYAIAPWILPRLTRARHPFRGLLFCWVAAIFVPTVALLYGFAPGMGGPFVALEPFVRVWPPFHLPAFVFGVLLYRARQVVLVRAVWLPVCLLVLVLMLCALPWSLVTLLQNGGLLPLYGVVVLAAASTHGSLLQRRGFVFLGEASYATYIVQAPVGLWLKEPLAPLGPTFGFLAFVICLVALSAILHVTLELPVQRWLLRRQDPAH